MKLKILVPCLLLLSVATLRTFGQTSRPDKLYSMSGIGFAFPMGQTSDYFKPKFSTTLGVNLGLGDGGLFLYPKVSLHAFSYNQIVPDAGYTYTLQDSRATTYLLNVALGYRKIVNKWAFYGFAGAGGGFILTPQAAVNASTLQVTMSNQSNALGIAEGGGGIEYNIGGANLFAEVSYMYGFSKIQDRTFNTVPVTIGIKPNLSKLLRKR
ncbi:hypothetical protein [Pedobacter frigidisoli]|uniref:hypothetical protein n=1 Tax=Pedobacter frigidisoli TaxID=2530455 RepID=UPI0029302876|nr:hypothetical protein [Pedobacter frigidisoli]